MKNRSAIAAADYRRSLWGITVALSKVSLHWLTPSWLAAAAFMAAAPILAFVGRRGLRNAFTPRVLISGAIGLGIVVLLQMPASTTPASATARSSSARCRS